MTHLTLHELSKRYPGQPGEALLPLSCSLAQGELVALLGESGSGKSTVLRLIAGFEEPSHGRIVLAGRELCSPTTWVAPEKRAISMVFQDLALFPHLTIGENLAYGLFRLAKCDRQARVTEILAMVGLPGHEKRFPHQLSGGERQRIALGRALAPRPALLLLDEPLSALDEVLRVQMRDELARLIRASGTTALWVTHDTGDALSTVDRVLILRQGRFQQFATPEIIYQQPANAYVAKLFGMGNIFQGTARDGGFETALGFLPHPAAARYRGSVSLGMRPTDLHLVTAGTPPAHAFTANIRRIAYLGQ